MRVNGETTKENGAESKVISLTSAFLPTITNQEFSSFRVEKFEMLIFICGDDEMK